MRSPALRWLERALLVVAVLCLGGWAWSWLDASYIQYRDGKLLDEARRTAPARETDALGAFQPMPANSRQARQSRPPASEGALVGRIEIPRVGVSTIVLEGVGETTLRRGAGHIPETALPQDGGNVGIAAHRDSFFRALKDIRKNDIIRLETLEGTFQYSVQWTEIVKPEDTEVLTDQGKPALTLVTCYPFYYVGSAPKRFIVRALRVEEGADDAGGPGLQ